MIDIPLLLCGIAGLVLYAVLKMRGVGYVL